MKYVAFLRGINVGGRIIKMSELKACLQKAGLQEVATVLQTGNVLFESLKTSEILKPEIETALNNQFNYPAKVQVISIERLEQIIHNFPFKPKEGFHNYVIFLENKLETELITEATELSATEDIQADQGVIYWQVEKGMTLKSPFAKLLSKAKYKDFNTNRNLNTLAKLI